MAKPLGFVGVDAAIAKLKKHKALIHDSIAKTKRSVVESVFRDLVTNSPQWSGNLAQQWYIELHGSKGSYNPVPGYASPDKWKYSDTAYQRGDDPAVSRTLARELVKIPSIRWNSKIQIANYAPYAQSVEYGVGPDGKPIREVNKLAAYGGVAMVGYVTMKYNNLRNLRKLK